jgi:hypothetical protein
MAVTMGVIALPTMFSSGDSIGRMSSRRMRISRL